MATEDILPPASPFQRVAPPSQTASPFQRETGMDQDIENLENIRQPNSDFFDKVLGDPGLSPKVKDDIVNAALSREVNLSKIKSDLVRQRQTEQLNDFRIENERLRLQQARQVSQQRMIAPGRAAEYRQNLESIFDNPNLSKAEKASASYDLAARNSDLLSSDNSLAVAGDSFRASLGLPSESDKARADRLQASMLTDIREDKERAEDSREKQVTAIRKEVDDIRNAKVFSKTEGTNEVDDFENFQDPADKARAQRLLERLGGTPGESDNRLQLIDKIQEQMRRLEQTSGTPGAPNPTRTALESIPPS